MSGTEIRSPSHPRARRLRALLVAGIAGLLAAILFSLTTIPDAHHGLRRLRGTSGWSVLAPGIAWRIPIVQEFELTPDEVTVRGQAQVPAPTGAGTRIDYAITARFTDDMIRMAASRSMRPGEFLAASVGTILEATQAQPGASVESVLRSELARRGLTGLIVSAGEGAGAPPARRRSLEHPIVLVGLDGADWQVAEPFIEAGRLPVLAKLRREGAWGHLRSSAPMLSPLLWTTAATGKTPEAHGIVDFLVPDPASGKKVPITSGFRRVKALWNILGEAGRFSTIVAWWATFPAEAIRGEIISDRVAYSLFDIARPAATGSGLVFPESLWAATASRIVDAGSISARDLSELARVGDAEVEGARKALKAGESGATRDRLTHLMKILASTRTYHALALDRISAGQPDLLAVYYQGIDEVSHRFAHCAPPAMPLCPAAEAARFGGTVAAFYEYQDRLLGEILDAVDPSSRVIVMSDHGFRNGGDRPTDVAPDIDGKPAKWHRPYGVAVIAGPGVTPGRLDTVTLLDIAPTVLRLAGLPIAGDMPGRSLVNPASPDAFPPAIASYETPGGRMDVATLTGASDPGQEEMLENLRSLGYIGEAEEGEGAPLGSAGGANGETPGTVTAHTNVGSLHLQKGEIEEAEAQFRAALAIAPAYLPALMGMAEVRARQNRLDDAFAYTGRALGTSAEPEPGLYIRLAVLATHSGAVGEAEATLERLRRSGPGTAEIDVGLAILAEHRGEMDRAKGLLVAALATDPAGAEAMARLFRMRRVEGREASLEPAIRKALQSNPGSVLHHNWLGLILDRRGDTIGAEREFKTALEIAPDFGGTMANLGSLYGRTGRIGEAVGILERALRIEPFNLEARVNLGAALGKLGRTEEALKVLEKGRQSAPGSPEILNALAVTYAQMGDTAQASALFRESLRIRGDQPRVRDMLREIEGGL